MRGRRSSPVFRDDRLPLGRGSVHLRPSLVALDSRGPAPSTVPRDSSSPPCLGMRRQVTWAERGRGRDEASNPSPPPPGQDSSVLILKVLGTISAAQIRGEEGFWNNQSISPSCASVLNPLVSQAARRSREACVCYSNDAGLA